jgi:hypothetical protein
MSKVSDEKVGFIGIFAEQLSTSLLMVKAQASITVPTNGHGLIGLADFPRLNALNAHCAGRVRM